MPDNSARHADARRRQELADQAARAEARAAQALIEDFIGQATARSVAPEPLRARLLNGTVVKTDKRGWYLRRDHSVAIGTDGSYYVLTVPGSAMARWTGVKLQATPPPLVIGRGGRDGETGDLKDFLARRLADG